ncbi:hypothetical protein [Kaistia sp. UC242_56]|uniref:hypothetical protein n=1 Tax=Kaistia sp. UC242_56 TaxID=3374625 RepID=UPI0037AA7C79
MKKARATSRLDRWRKSPQFRLIARAQCRRMNAAKVTAKRCGARRKRDGQPCELEALENGRCYLHGGRTPKGDQWHCPVWPDKNAPNANAKLARKLQDLERAAQKRAMRLATMSPEERAAHERWQKSHPSGSAGTRATDRARRRQDAEARKLFAQLEPAPPRIPKQQH